MRPRILFAAVAIAMGLIGWRLLAQETVATPDPVGGVKIDAGANVHVGVPTQSAPAASVAVTPTTDNWRYRWHGGRWWYWTPQKHWMWYSDDGRWVEYDADHGPAVVEQSVETPAPYGTYYPGGYYYPRPGYWSGYYYPRYYYPGVTVGVGPYGNVGVGVGRRVGVDVWGPYGGVRVGRLYVGW